MKIVRAISLLTIAFSLIVLSVIYQSCKPLRQCQLLLGFDITPFNHVTYDTLGSMDSVKAADFMIEVTPKHDVFSCKAGTGFSFIEPAMAYKRVVQTVYFDTIKRITIFSDQDFDATHPAGTLLNDLFQIPDPFPSYNEQYGGFHYSLTKAPDTETYHRFRISVEVSMGIKYNYYSTIFPPIKILQ